MPTSPSSPTRTVSATPATTSPSRAAGVTDYRANIERQSREQKSVGGILSLAVYSLIGLFVLGALLASYGAYVFSKQIHQQSVTMSDLDNRYAAQNQALTAELKTTQEALVQVQAQSQRQQELLVRQQEAISKLLAAGTDDANAIRQEKAARAEEASIRASETAALRSRVRTLEARTESIYRP
jgi:Spy/CpxP family protein refolding chaperone